MRGARPDSTELLGAAAVVAVACCAGVPLLGTLLGALTLAAVLGVAGGVLLCVAGLSGAVYLLRARRCDCAPINRDGER